MNHLTDQEIINSVKRGNSADFSLLIDRYKDKAFSMLRRMLKNSLDAEEALQDTFLKAFYGLNNFHGDSQFSTWLYKITYNCALSMIASKKRKIEMEMTSIDEHFELGNFDNEIYSTSENASDFIYKMIDKLPIRNAIVLILFYIDGLSLNEISSVLNTSLVNTKVLLHRSRISLRNLLLKHNYMPEKR